MTSQFIYVPPDPPINPDLNRNCVLRVTMIEGKFFKDNDTFGKQDPFAQFDYDGELMKTKVMMMEDYKLLGTRALISKMCSNR